MPWEGPYAVVKIFGDVLCVILRNRRCKPRIVHRDKLCLAKNQLDNKWVFSLPKKTRELLPETSYEGLAKLFAEPPTGGKIPKTPDVVPNTPTPPNVTEVTQKKPVSTGEQKITRSGKQY